MGGLIGASGGFGPYGNYNPYGSLAPVSQSYATGTVTGGSQSNVGGLIGNSGSQVQTSYAAGNVRGGSSSNVGGLLGVQDQYGSLSKSFATGSVTGSDSQNVGGLVGWNADTRISQTYALGAVNGNGSANVGGLVGENGGIFPGASIDQSYSAGPVSNVGGGQTGGLVGLNYPLIYNGPNSEGPGSVTNSYWDATASGQTTSSGGVSLTTSQLQSGRLPSGFDPTVWSAPSGSYPILGTLAGESTGQFSIVVTVNEPNQNDGGFTHISATATPTDGGSLQSEAQKLGYIGFDWIQTVDSGPSPFPQGACTGLSDGTCTGAELLSAPWADPPLYGYVACENSDCSQFIVEADRHIPPRTPPNQYGYLYDPIQAEDYSEGYCIHPVGNPGASCAIDLVNGNSLNFSDQLRIERTCSFGAGGKGLR